jgi:hypothetical protein
MPFTTKKKKLKYAKDEDGIRIVLMSCSDTAHTYLPVTDILQLIIKVDSYFKDLALVIPV